MSSSSIVFRVGILSAIFLGASARASQVLSVDKGGHTIVVSQRSSGAWAVDESICVLHEWKEAACGVVTEVTPDSAKVRLKPGGGAISIGDFVESATTVKAGGPPVPAGTLPLPKNVRLLHLYENRIGVTLEAGPNYVFPGVQYQFELDRRTCLGLTGGSWAVSPSQASLSGFGAIVGLSFYQTRCYEGLWLNIDAGGYLLSAKSDTAQETVNTLAAGMGAGWDVKLSDRMMLRLGGGARYLSHPHAASVSYALDPWIYFFNGSLGWKF